MAMNCKDAGALCAFISRFTSAQEFEKWLKPAFYFGALYVLYSYICELVLALIFVMKFYS